MSILDSVIAALATAASGRSKSSSSGDDGSGDDSASSSAAANGGGGGGGSNDPTPAAVLASLSLKQLEVLREPMDWIGAVFCNTVRPLLLVQGKWSYQVTTIVLQNHGSAQAEIWQTACSIFLFRA